MQLLFLTCLFIAFKLHAQNINTAKLDSLFNNLETKNLAMGSVAISYKGKIVYKKAIGAATIVDNGNIHQASEETLYRIGSITKTFTAALIFQLIEKGQLSVDTPLKNYFPNLPNASKITIAHMLSHKSGVPDFTRDTNFESWKNLQKTHTELLAMIEGRKPEFEPGFINEYNNTNYLLLGYIIEVIYKKNYETVLQEKIIKKLKLSHTYYGTGGAVNQAKGYKYAEGKWDNDSPTYIENFGGAGAIISTPADMITFINALFSGKLINKHSLEQMTTLNGDYGMGLFGYEFRGHKGFGHNGKTEGFSSTLTYYPYEELAIAYCTNGELLRKAEIVNGVLAICYDMPYKTPTYEPITLTEIWFDRYTGTYTSSKIGMQVACTIKDGILTIEVKGKPISLIALEKDKFMNAHHGFFIDFKENGKKMIIYDVDAIYTFEKQ